MNHKWVVGHLLLILVLFVGLEILSYLSVFEFHQSWTLRISFWGPMLLSWGIHFFHYFRVCSSSELNPLERCSMDKVVENQFLITLNSIGDGVISTNLKGKITLINPTAERMTGWESSAAVGKPIKDVFRVINSQTREPVVSPVDKVLISGKRVGLANHTALLSKDGTEYQIADSGAPILDEQGVIQGVVLVFSDVTEDYEIRKSLTRSEERFRLAMESTTDAIFDANPVTGEGYISPVWFRTLGYEPGEFSYVPSSWLSLVHPDDLALVQPTIEALFSGVQEACDLEYRLRSISGEWIWVRQKARVLSRTQDGRASRIIGSVNEITERKKSELELKKTLATLKEAQQVGRIGISEFDFKTGISTISKELADMHGRTKLEWTSEEVQELSYPEDWNTWNDALQRAIENREDCKCQFKIKNQKTGNDSWVEVNYRIQYDENGDPIYALGTNVEITEYVLLERRLRHLNAVLRSLRSVGQLIIDQDEIDKLITNSIQVIIDERGFTSGWIFVKMEDEEFFASKGYKQDLESLKRIIINSNGVPHLLELSNIKEKEGVYIGATATAEFEYPYGFPELEKGEIPAKIFCMPLVYGAKNYGYLGLGIPSLMADDPEELRLFRELGRDIAYALYSIQMVKEKKQAFQELQIQKEQAERANAAKDEFLAVMSHEMRTPLNPIVGFSEVLLEEISDPLHREYLSTINASSEHLLSIITAILEFSRLNGATDIQPKKQKFNLLDICQQVLNDHKFKAQHVSLAFINPVEGWNPVSDTFMVNSDKHMLLQILENLLSNALKYTSSGSVQLEIGMNDDGDGSRCRQFLFAVRDTGIGMEAQELTKIFDPFSQVDSSFTRDYEGIGLGLAICKELCGLLGGSIDVESELGKGSCFTLELPLEVMGLTDAESNHSTALPEDFSLENIRVLLVEDNTTNIKVIRTILERVGSEVVSVMNGEDAIDRYGKESFQMVLMDISLPGMDGLQTIQTLESKYGKAQLCPIIAVSANAYPSDKEASLKAGAKAHLSKPISKVELLSCIKQFAG